MISIKMMMHGMTAAGPAKKIRNRRGPVMLHACPLARKCSSLLNIIRMITETRYVVQMNWSSAETPDMRPIITPAA